MGRKQKIYEKLEVIDIGATGKAVAKTQTNKVVFIDNAVPGDIVDVKTRRQKTSFAEGKAIHFHKFSDKRQKPFCPHFGRCGGCKWQNIKYEHQLEFKENFTLENLKRIGLLSDICVKEPIVASENTQYYRNKLEFTFSNKKWVDDVNDFDDPDINMNALGFHIPGVHYKIVDIEQCFLQPEPSNKIRLAVKNYAIKNNYDFFNLSEYQGFLRNLIIRTTEDNQCMVIVVFGKKDTTAQNNLLYHLKNTFPEITSLMYIINPKKNDTIYDLDVHIFSGQDYITEKMEDLTFKIRAKSFFQTNTKQAILLYQKIREFANVSNTDTVYDLYTGTGTIAQFVAKHAKHVIGIDTIEMAIKDAQENAKLNKISNCTFFAGDVKDVFKNDLIEKYGKPDILITDPPRAGMHKSVIYTILKLKPKRIIYVSCNPSTQARDIQLLSEAYKTDIIQPFDLFPHTYHVENIALLTLKNTKIF